MEQVFNFRKDFLVSRIAELFFDCLARPCGCAEFFQPILAQNSKQYYQSFSSLLKAKKKFILENKIRKKRRKYLGCKQLMCLSLHVHVHKMKINSHQLLSTHITRSTPVINDECLGCWCLPFLP